MALDLALLPPRISKQILQTSTCWLWTGRLNRNGYGRTYYKGKERVTHRVVWEYLVGPIPDKLLLDHVKEKCVNRNCCNPAHLEPVTHRENTLRGGAILFRKREAFNAQPT
jgi:hypothetical protein